MIHLLVETDCEGNAAEMKWKFLKIILTLKAIKICILIFEKTMQIIIQSSENLK